MPFQRTARLDLLPPYLFIDIDRKKRAALAAGKDVIDFGVGDPDRPTPKFIIDRMADIAHDSPEFLRLTAMFMNYITQGVDAHARDNAGVSVLNHALQRENYLVPGMLVAAGVNVNEKFPQKNGDTPLHVAVELAVAGKGVRLLDLLLNAKADPTAVNDNGVSAFDIVRRAETENAADVMAKISAAPQLQEIFAAERAAHQQKLRPQAKRFKLGGS